MTAMTLYLAEAHLSELHEARRRGGWGDFSGLLTEALQVLKGGLMPSQGSTAALDPHLRRDLNLM